MREPPPHGTLVAQRAILQSTVDRLVVKRRSAELYYQFLCAALYKVPPGVFEHKGAVVLRRIETCEAASQRHSEGQL